MGADQQPRRRECSKTSRVPRASAAAALPIATTASKRAL